MEKKYEIDLALHDQAGRAVSELSPLQLDCTKRFVTSNENSLAKDAGLFPFFRKNSTSFLTILEMN